MKREKGSLTLEATIFLTLFLLFFLSLMDIVQIGRTQMILQYTVNQTAKEIAQSTYILTKTGIVDKSIKTSKKSAEFVNKTDEVLDSIFQVAGAISGDGDIVNTAIVAAENLEDYFSNSEELLNGVVALVKTVIINEGKEWAVGAACKGSLKKQISYLTEDDPDTYLKKLGIDEGLQGISFDGTKWFDGNRDLDIVLTYKMKYELGFLGTQERVFKVRAKTAIW